MWCVQITGNSSVPSAQIESALAAAGLSQGTWKKDVSPERLAQQMLLKFPRIRWMSVNTQGCTAQVVIQEKTEKPDVVEENRICNIKASATGQIVMLHVFAGTALVHKGDAVVEGQLLVSAVVEDELGGSTLKHASAEIIAETAHTLTVQIELNRRRWEPTGKTVFRRNLDLFGARLPASFQTKPRGTYQVSREKADLQLLGTVLPVGVYTERWDEMRAVDTVLTKEQARTLAAQEIEKQEKELLKGGKVTAARTSEKWETGALIDTVQLTCEENIAKESEIFIK